MSAGDGDVCFQGLGIQVCGGLPGGATSAFDKSKFGVEINGAGVVITDMKPDVVDPFLAGVLYGAFSEGAGNASAAICRMHSNVGNQVDTLFIVSKRDEAGVADDLSALFPDIARERQGRGLGGAVGPFNKRVVFACAAHVLHVAPAVRVHGAGEAQLDKVCDSGQVTQDAEWAKVGMTLSARWDGNGGHVGIIVGLRVVGGEQLVVDSWWQMSERLLVKPGFSPEFLRVLVSCGAERWGV